MPVVLAPQEQGLGGTLRLEASLTYVEFQASQGDIVWPCLKTKHPVKEMKKGFGGLLGGLDMAKDM